MAGYGSDGDMTEWMASNGYAPPSGDLSLAILRQRGSDHVDGLYGASLPGYPTGGIDQERAQPRTGAKAFRQAIPSDVVPLRWIHASYFAALQEGLSPGVLSASASTAGAVKRRKVDVIEVEFFEGSGNASADATPRWSVIDGLVAPFLVPVSPDGPAIWSIG